MEIIGKLEKLIVFASRIPSIILGVILFLQALEIIPIEGVFYKPLFVLSGLHLIGTYFYRGIITPEAKSPLCHFCGGYMITETLKCRDCGSTSLPKKEEGGKEGDVS